MYTNGRTTFINSAICSNRYKADFDPIVFDIPIPTPFTRQNFVSITTETLRKQKRAEQETSEDGGSSNQEGGEEKGAVGGYVDKSHLLGQIKNLFNKDKKPTNKPDIGNNQTQTKINTFKLRGSWKN